MKCDVMPETVLVQVPSSADHAKPKKGGIQSWSRVFFGAWRSVDMGCPARERSELGNLLAFFNY